VTAIFAASDERVLVAETGRNTVAELEVREGKVVRRYVVGKGGDGVAITP
jgi:hypothetical protein